MCTEILVVEAFLACFPDPKSRKDITDCWCF